jgi:hypothetical protein
MIITTQFQASTRAALIYVRVLASFPVESTLLLLHGPGHLAWSRGLSASQSAYYFMYISLGHGHLSPGHDTSQYTLQHTSSPALNC